MGIKESKFQLNHTNGSSTIIMRYEEVGDTIIFKDIRLGGDFMDITDRVKSDPVMFNRLKARFERRLSKNVEGLTFQY